MSVRILVVDDSKLARMVLTRAIRLAHPEWICLEAKSAEEALTLLDREPAQVAVMDYNMPGMNGLDLAREVRKRSPEMPIAIVTANIQTDIMSAARTLRAHIVPKPIGENGLQAFLSAAERSIVDTN